MRLLSQRPDYRFWVRALDKLALKAPCSLPVRPLGDDVVPPARGGVKVDLRSVPGSGHVDCG